MKPLTLLLLLASMACASTVQGVIFDEETRNPLARTQVTLMPIPGNPAPELTILANERGYYSFSDVRSGWYLLRASRIGYATAEYGQSRPGQAGRPFEIDALVNTAADLRQIVMRRQSAITGSIVDDNSIGIPGWPVVVYTARQPIRRVAAGATDDRGNFRIGELDPGSYLVRSGGGGSEDAGALIPSFYKYGTSVAGAEAVRVRVGETQSFVTIHALEGQLFELTGNVSAPDLTPVRVIMITDTMHQTISTARGPFTVSAVPPGTVDLLTEGPGCAGFVRLNMDRNMFAGLTCLPLSRPVVSGAGNNPVIARRVDPDGRGPGSAVSGDYFPPGEWEFTVRPTPSQYLVAIQDADAAAQAMQNDGWFSVRIGNAPHLRVTLSDKPATISGTVSSGSLTVAGAPVYLERLDPAVGDAVQQSWTVRADVGGGFTFGCLAPGNYRLMSSLDLEMEDPLARNAAVSVTLREGETVSQALRLVLP